MIWVAKNLYFFNCLLDGAHTTTDHRTAFLSQRKSDFYRIKNVLQDGQVFERLVLQA